MDEVDEQRTRFVERNVMLHGAVGLLSLGTRVAAAAMLPADEPAHRAEAVDFALLGMLALALHLEDRLDLHTPELHPHDPVSPGQSVPRRLLR